MTAYITRYALTSGIEQAEGECYDNGIFGYSINGHTNYVHGNGWHKTKDAALECAESMRLKKIASLKKSIAKLEKLTFD